MTTHDEQVMGPPALDYAVSGQVDRWTRHPVYGDPSFDSFERYPCNPIHRGIPGWEWPVNGFLFADPISGHWYVYVGDYREGYAMPWRCILYRSRDRGQVWENLGPVLEGDSRTFDYGGGTPDASVVYADGRYHMVYDWAPPPKTGGAEYAIGGIAYAWAEQPEGPFHRDPQPLLLNARVKLLRGRYQRVYATTLIRRANDWLLLSLIDHAPHSWSLCAMTAANPQGPYSEPHTVRAVEDDYYHPPLMEFFPAFVHEGYVYAPATSVALNRNFNALWRAPLEQADETSAWTLHRHGSTWHSEDVENEAQGIWGQTYSGWVDKEGVLHVMFASRDSKGMGTINLAHRRWDTPLRERGFVLTGHQGPSLTLLRQSFGKFLLDSVLQVRGTARLLWNHRGVLGPNVPQSDATLHPLCGRDCWALEMTLEQWRVMCVDAGGVETTLASGSRTASPTWRVMLERKPGDGMVLSIDGHVVWSTAQSGRVGDGSACILGLWTDAYTHVSVDQFCVLGAATAARLFYLHTEALLGAGESPADWDAREDAGFRYRCGLVSRRERARVKWNVCGGAFALWSPRDPAWGVGRILVDGTPMGTVDFRSAQPLSSGVVWASAACADGPHAIVLEAIDGVIPVDCLEAIT